MYIRNTLLLLLQHGYKPSSNTLNEKIINIYMQEDNVNI